MQVLPPSALPEGCPPLQSSPATGHFYRLATKDSVPGERPEPATWILPVNNKKSEAAESECDSYAFSIYDDAEVLRVAARLTPWAKGKPLCEFTIPHGCGRLLSSEGELCPGHHDWWPEPLTFVPVAVVMAA